MLQPMPCDAVHIGKFDFAMSWAEKKAERSVAGWGLFDSR
jgi:hypothetical protein